MPSNDAVRARTLGARDEKVVVPAQWPGHLRTRPLVFRPGRHPVRYRDGPGYARNQRGASTRGRWCGLLRWHVRYAAVSASTEGTLAHGPSILVTTNLTWRDRRGAAIGTVGSPNGYRSPRLSPDGRSVAVTIVDPQTQSPDIWILDLTSGGPSRVTSDPRNDWFPTWAPDGQRLFFSSTRAGSSTLFQKGIG